MKEEDQLYLRHILDAIANIESYCTETKNYEEFCRNSMAYNAIIRQLEIIGEAAKHLSTNCKNKLKQIPWKDITGMRDKLIHEYFGVDLEAVWRTVQDDLPVLKRAVQSLL